MHFLCPITEQLFITIIIFILVLADLLNNYLNIRNANLNEDFEKEKVLTTHLTEKLDITFLAISGILGYALFKFIIFLIGFFYTRL
ncbi:MAG: hypothetical protein ACRCYE_08640 [Sarcina sp.]